MLHICRLHVTFRREEALIYSEAPRYSGVFFTVNCISVSHHKFPLNLESAMPKLLTFFFKEIIQKRTF